MPGAPPLTEAADPEQAGEPLPSDLEGVQAREHRVAGLYVLEVVLGHVPFDADLPIVMMLHGRGDRPRVPGGPFGGAPTPMRLLLPRAPKPLGNGFTWLPLSVTENRADVMADTLRRRADQLAQVLIHFRNVRVSRGKPIVTGFSQGAMLTYTLAILHPELLDSALPIAGWLPPSLIPSEVPAIRRVPIRSIHGDADPVVRIGPTRELIARLRGLGFEIEWVEERGTQHVVSETMNVIFERWLEEALARVAPELAAAGQGLGEAGPEDVTYAPFLPLDTSTVEAIQAVEQEAAASEEAGERPTALEPSEEAAEPSERSRASRRSRRSLRRERSADRVGERARLGRRDPTPREHGRRGGDSGASAADRPTAPRAETPSPNETTPLQVRPTPRSGEAANEGPSRTKATRESSSADRKLGREHGLERPSEHGLGHRLASWNAAWNRHWTPGVR
ncbi:MAG: hypothetical protein H6721_23970 [Sandaracinus sp.]|nr:hypothetical protein [Sandaracinus sp.]